MAVIFVCGVHGAGKTTFCQKLAKELNVPHFSASALIKEKSAQAISDEAGDKRVKNIDDNQTLLIAAVREKTALHDKIILDGHTTIIDKSGCYQRLPETVFRDLGITAMVLLQVPAPEIARRLSLRDGAAPDADFIAAHQAAEKEHARHLADAIKVQLYNLDGNEEELLDIVEKL